MDQIMSQLTYDNSTLQNIANYLSTLDPTVNTYYDTDHGWSKWVDYCVAKYGRYIRIYRGPSEEWWDMGHIMGMDTIYLVSGIVDDVIVSYQEGDWSTIVVDRKIE